MTGEGKSLNNSVNTKIENTILGSLPAESYQKIAGRLEQVDMPHAKSIYKINEPIKHIYFPENSVISVVTYLQNGNCVETGIIGNDGLSGAEIVLSEDRSPREAMVQLAGTGKRISTDDFKEICQSDAVLMRLVMRFIYSFIGQISQNPACLCFHTIEKRLARWLLMFHDRADSDELKLTQEFIAVMLGVHRPSVSKFAAKLQEKGLINYNRGKIKILNRSGLEEMSCECYETICEVSGYPVQK